MRKLSIKKLLLLIAFLGVIGVIVTFSYLRTHGFSARAKPNPVEEAFALAARKLVLPSAVKKKVNPLPQNDIYLAQAREHYADHCAVCHDIDGSGETKISAGMYPPTPDLRSKRSQSLSDGELFYITKEGIRFSGMPGFGGSDNENWKLVQFIRHLPNISNEELELMK